MLIFSSCPKGITRLFLGGRTSNTRASSVFRSDRRPATDHPFTRPLGLADVARGFPEPGEAGRPAATVDRGSSFPWSAPARGRRGMDFSCGARTRSARSPRAFTRRMSPPAEGEGGTLERRSGVVSQKLLQGARVAGLHRVFRASPLYSSPPENVAASRRSLPGGRCQARCASVPMATARTDRGCGEHP